MSNSRQNWEALRHAAELVGAASETADLPDAFRNKLIDVLVDLVWVSQSIRCPACGCCWRKKGCER
jgi:hypothetical protein